MNTEPTQENQLVDLDPTKLSQLPQSETAEKPLENPRILRVKANHPNVNQVLAINMLAKSIRDVDGVVVLATRSPKFTSKCLDICGIENKRDETTVSFILPEWMEVTQ